MRIPRMLALGAAGVVLLSACSLGGGSSTPTVKIGSVGFDEARVMAEIYAQVLEENGYTVNRDGIGLGLDLYTDPLGEVRPIDVRNSLAALRLTGSRADLLEASRILEQAALDRYVFQRDAYLQRRRSLVYDGRPPRERLDDDEPVNPQSR